MLADLAHQPADAMVCLGDALQGGVQPARVVGKLAELGCPVILGNADAFVVGDHEERANDDQLRVRDWTAAQIGDEGAALIRSFYATHLIELDGAGLLAFHGSPRSFEEVLLPESPDAAVEDALGGHEAIVYAGGHTHLQWTRRFGDKTFLNPGSVGLAYRRYLPRASFRFEPIAQYAIVTTSGSQVAIEFCRAPFDVDELATAALASGHPFAGREAGRFG
jgi:predicted phosphodiesterase